MKEVKENLCYDVLLEQVPKNLLDGIVDVIVDTLCTPTPTVRIAGETVPREEVCRRFRALDQMDIYYVNLLAILDMVWLLIAFGDYAMAYYGPEPMVKDLKPIAKDEE